MNNKELTNAIFSKRLKEKREEKELTMLQLGSAVGVSDATISRYEAGKRSPDFIIVMRLADYFNVTLDWFGGLEGGTDTDSLVNLYNELSEETKKEAYQYMIYLKGRG